MTATPTTAGVVNDPNFTTVPNGWDQPTHYDITNCGGTFDPVAYNCLTTGLLKVLEKGDVNFTQCDVEQLQKAIFKRWIGVALPYFGHIAPTNALFLDGSQLAISNYPDLFAIFGNKFGGDGINNFNLPDLRGRFIRGVDNGAGHDPDAIDRTNRGDGVTGDNVGTLQQDQIKSHAHSIATSDGGTDDTDFQMTNTQSNNDDIDGYASNPTGGAETRPINISANFITYYR